MHFSKTINHDISRGGGERRGKVLFFAAMGWGWGAKSKATRLLMKPSQDASAAAELTQGHF